MDIDPHLTLTKIADTETVYHVIAYKCWLRNPEEAYYRRPKANSADGFEPSLSVIIRADVPDCAEIAANGLSSSFGLDALMVAQVRAITYTIESRQQVALTVERDSLALLTHAAISAPHPMKEKLHAGEVASALHKISNCVDRNCCESSSLRKTEPCPEPQR